MLKLYSTTHIQISKIGTKNAKISRISNFHYLVMFGISAKIYQNILQSDSMIITIWKYILLLMYIISYEE